MFRMGGIVDERNRDQLEVLAPGDYGDTMNCSNPYNWGDTWGDKRNTKKNNQAANDEGKKPIFPGSVFIRI